MGFDHFDCSVPGDRAVPSHAPRRRRWARPAAGAWRRVCAAWERERAPDRRRRAGATFVAVTLMASSAALADGPVVAQQSEQSQMCVRELEAFGADATSTVSGGGIIAVDASCVSTARNPDVSELTYYARRHVFTLDTAATMSVGVGGSGTYLVLLEGRSVDGSGTVVGRAASSRSAASLRHLLLAAGTYTIEATTNSSEATGSYSVWASRSPADGCVRELEAFGADATSTVSGGGIIAVDASCVSTARNPDVSELTYYARRHVFTLDTAATMSVGVGGSGTYLVLLEGRSVDGSGTVVGRAASSRSAASLRHLLLAAGTYTIEATTNSSEATGSYSVWASRSPADGCVRELEAFGADATSTVSGGGIIAVDASCVSTARNPDVSELTYYARRHVFTLDTAATMSVGVGGSGTYLVLLEGRSVDGSGTVVGRAASSRSAASLRHLLLAAGTYTIEATTNSSEATGSYSVWASRSPADGCVRELEAFGADATSTVSGGGIIAVDASCVSTARNPDVSELTYYARRHVFTLDTAATMSVGVGGSGTYLVLLEGRSVDGSGTVVGRTSRSRLDHLLLAAGTYTIEATTNSSEATGSYSVWASRAPADGCVRELEAFGADATSTVSGGGIIAVDASCVSPQRNPDVSELTYYARRHVFTLDTAATMSVGVGGSGTYLVLLEGRSVDGSGTVVGRTSRSRLDHLLLAAGTYTIEATTNSSEATGSYSVWASRAPADGCVRELEAFGADATTVTGGGIIAVDASCVSTARNPDVSELTYYARRHVFTLDTAATMSVGVGGSGTYLVLLEGRSVDGSGTVVGRTSRSRLDHLLLAAGTYTIEATTNSSEATGSYSVWASRAPADGCVRELEAFGADATSTVSGGGIIAVDASCVSTARNPDVSELTYYARRHVFTLDTAATMSVGVGGSGTYLVLLEGRSVDGSGTVVGRTSRSRLDHLLLAAGTYTIEATTNSSEATGSYSVWASRAPADGCVRELEAFGADATSTVSGGGIIAVDASCVSPQRNPDVSELTYYARRHVFTLDAAATMSVGVGGSGTYLVLLEGRSVDGSGTVVGRTSRSRLDHLLLAAGTYTIEATTNSSEATGRYSVWASRSPAHEPLGAALVGGAIVELVYDSALDESSVPAIDAFFVDVDGASRAITEVTVRGHVVTLTLASPVVAAQEVTVSYAVPTAAGAHRLETPSGEAARGFSDRLVVIPPGAPAITAVASSGDGSTSGLTVSWTAVAAISGYDLEWRQDGEESWQSHRVDVREQFTLEGLVRGAVYWVRVRAVETGGETDQTLFVTDWSAAESGIAGDLIPQDLRVAVGDGMLTLIWDEVPAATGYEVEYWPTERVSERATAVAVRGEERWRAVVAGLNNGESYGIAVRSVRSVAAETGVSGGLAETVRSPWATSVAMPGSYVGARMWTFYRIGVLYERIRGAAYSVWWRGSCDGDYVLWQRRADDETWTLVGGLAYTVPADGYGPHSLTAPEFGFSFSTGSFFNNSRLDFRAAMRRAEGRRFQLRCAPTSESPPTTAEDPPGVLLGEVVFHYNSGSPPQAPPNVTATTHLNGEAIRPGELVVSWDGFDDSELTRIRSSVVGYKVRWRWFDGDDEYTDATPSREIAPFARSYVIGGLATGRDYEVSVRAESSTDDGTWSSWVAKTVQSTSILAAVLVGGATVELVYDTALDESSVPPVDAFTVTADAASQTISGVTVTGQKGTLTLASPITSAQMITVSYTPPTATDAAPIQATGGETAAGFTDQPVTIPPDPPTITSVESATGGLEVQWDAVADISGYDLEWRQDGEATWQSTRTDQQQHTISALTDGALYWVRLRAVKTHESLDGETLYTTGWSQPEPGIAGDWAPRNVAVTPGDRTLTVTWDGVDAADDYEAQWQPKSTASSGAPSDGGGLSESPSRQRRPDSATSRNVLPPLPELRPDAWSSVPFEPVASSEPLASAWSATVTNLGNGEDYSVRVRSLRSVDVGAGDSTQQSRVLASGWIEAKSAPAVSFVVSEIAAHGRESFERSGNTAQLQLRLVHSGDGSSLSRIPLRALIESGPSDEAGVVVECIVNPEIGPIAFDRPSDECLTNSLGYMTVTYRVGAVDRNVEGWSYDTVRVYRDENENGAYDGRESYAEFTVPIAEPIDYVALGDSYSAGENGEYYSSEGFGPEFGDAYYYTDGASFDCHRWNNAYPILVANSDLNVNRLPSGPGITTPKPSPIGFYACTGALARNIYHSNDANNDGAPDDYDGTVDDFFSEFMRRPAVDDEYMTLATSSPSSSGAVAQFDHEESIADQDRSWEPRQIVSLRAKNAERQVDMVSLTIGGNNLGFAKALTRCLFRDVPVVLSSFFSSDLAFGEVQCARDGGFESRLDGLQEDLRDVLEEILGATSDAMIFVLGYPNLVPHDDRACSALTADPVIEVWDSGGISSFGQFLAGFLGDHEAVADASMSEDERTFIRNAAVALNGAIKSEVSRLNRDVVGDGGNPRVHFVDVMGRFEGHFACGDFVEVGDEAVESRSSLRGLWMNGVVADHRSNSAFPISGRSFHPTAAGHQGYATALGDYIRERIASGARVTGAGLPLAEVPATSPRGEPSGNDGIDREPAAKPQRSSRGTLGAEVRRVPLWARPAAGAESGCGVLWSPGERVELSTAGFAADSTVTLSAVAGTAARRDGSAVGTSLDPIVLPPATADGEGRLVVVWTVPAAPHATTPAWYAVTAAGPAESGGRLVARLVQPLVVYPGVQPCPASDVATTALGAPVRVDVLANDVAPAGGALDPSSVNVEPVGGVNFVVDPSDGSVTFTPDPGFVGSATTTYLAYDSWNVGIRAEVSVIVEAGCTITGGVPDGSGAVVEVTGTDGDDVICVGDRTGRRARYRIDAKAGDDVILAGAGPDVILGGAGADVIYGRGGDDQLDGGAGVDTVHGGGGFDSIYSADLSDSIVDAEDDAEDGYELVLTPVLLPAGRDGATAPVAGPEAVFAEPGGVVFVDVLGNDLDADGNLDGPSLAITRAPQLGSALVFNSVEAGLVVRYAAGDVAGVDGFAYEICDTLGACATAEVTVTVGVTGCTIVGSDGDDTLEGTSDNDVICGGAGDDTIVGLGGDDVIWGGAGDDMLTGGDGDDRLFGEAGADTLVGGTGGDELWGGSGADSLEGNSQDDTLHGGDGDDTLVGGGGADTLWGNAGADSLAGHAGDDAAHGGPGGDTIDGGNGADALWGGPGDDTLVGGAGDDTLHGGDGADTLRGNSQDDALLGGSGDDEIRGGGGNDELDGGAGDDVLWGNAGDDRLYGSWGDDTLTGGNGDDFLHGGEHADTCSRGPQIARCEA